MSDKKKFKTNTFSLTTVTTSTLELSDDFTKAVTPTVTKASNKFANCPYSLL